ncbi:Enamelin [Heterocephalus glaber]|uniref:Enamelin n=2 Tax=Heterocephalus glaber TaxID=10181 RepID=G5BMZ8_HETGA|nr:enamelin [Heterocephalus glaber]EHB10659.1 Enamelin [Heterocephalus glaber]
MLLLQCRKGASFPKLCNLVPNGKMKIFLVFLGLLGNSAAMPMYMPRMPGFSSKSEEMMRYGQFNYMHPPPMGPYGGGFQIPPPYPQYPMPPMWPQPSGWQNPPGPQHQTKADPTQETQKPNQTQPQKPPEQQPLNQPPQDPSKGKVDTQPPQPFPPFNNGLFPYQQPPWPIPQRMPPPGFGRPPLSNEEGGNPYFGFFGYPGFGGRPYYSEEIEDYEKPKEEDPPKPEDPPSEPSANSTVPETNSTQPGGQGKNDTSPTLNNVPGLNTGNNPTAQNGIFPLPRVNFSGQVIPRSQIPWKPSQPKIYEIYPNPNMRNSPSGRQSNPTGTATGQRQSGSFYQSQPGQRGQGNSFAWEGKQAARPRNPTYGKAYTPTSRVNYPNYAGNPANFRRKPQGPNKPFVGTSVTPLSPKQGTVGHNEKIQNPKGKSLGQKERTVTPTKDTSGSWRNSQHYGVNKPNLGWPHPEGNMLGPNFNSANQHENSYYSRGGSRGVPNSNAQTQSQNFPKGVALETKRIPYETQTKQPELKHSTHQPIYPEVIPSPKSEHFPAGRNTWSHQKIPPSFKEDPGKQEEHLPHLSPGSWGNVFYHEYNSYYPRENSPYIGGNTWDERVDSPNTMGQPKHPQYPLKTADQKETVHYNEEDPPDPTGDEPFPGQSRWGEEELSFNGRPTSRHYDGGKYALNQPKEYLPYSLDNPSKPREDSPYSEFYPWTLDETFPLYRPGPTTSPPMDSRGHYVNNAIQQEESTLFPSWNSWDHKIKVPGQQESEPYFNRNYWDQATNLQKVSLPNQKENYPYSSNPPAGLQKNPTWHEGEKLNYDMQMTRLNSPERQHLAFLDFIPQSYLSEQTEAHLFHQSPQSSCCVGSSTGPNENPLALQVYTPSYGNTPEENQNINPTYTESSHTKHARPIVSPANILPGQRNSSEKKLPGESQSPSTFRDDVPTLKNTPCSVNNQQGQVGIRSFPKASFPQSKNTPCLKNDLGGDGNNVLEQIFEGNHLNERTADLTPEQLVIRTADEGPKSEGIQNEIQGKEGEQQQQRPPSVLQVPCFGSQLTKLQSSSIGTPSISGRQGPFDRDLTMPTQNPNTFVGLATGEPFRSINIDQVNVDGHTPFESFQKGTDPQDQVQDCVLLQA